MLEIENATGVTPKALDDEPKLYGICVEMAHIYNTLASRRTCGFTPNPIQLSEIDVYLRIFGGPSIPVDVFLDLIGMMDVKYLELSNGDKPASKR